jgi:radical SAM protein with 4Fe4S-binding SPASM domain
MTMETVRLLLQNMGRYVEKVDLSGSGEPFMFDDIVEIIERCKRYGIMVTAATNCHFFTNPDFCRAVIRSGIDEIVGAIDGVTQESLKSFRGEKADLERVISGTRQLVEERNRLKSRRPLLNMLFVVNRFNEPDIEKALELAGEIGCDSLVPKYVGIDLMEREQERFLPEDLSRTRYEQKPDGTIGLKGDIQDKCATMYMNPMITWNGDVLPCCYDFHGDSVMGNVNEENFSSIWKSDRFARFRENVNSSRRTIDICSVNCPEGRISLTMKKR